jgi:hypothetical protein
MNCSSDTPYVREMASEASVTVESGREAVNGMGGL